jgi:RimJ/RimL family protein N-acetyltransferase
VEIAGSVRLEPWGRNDLRLLERLVGDASMMTHLGGPESPEKIAERQARYEQPGSKQFRIILERTGDAVGWVGYWGRSWRGDEVYEIGWAVLPEFHGRGIAGRATAQAIELAAAERERRYLHAFPSTENVPSNAICRKAGFVLLGELEFEYPRDSLMRCNDWRFDLLTRRNRRPT